MTTRKSTKRTAKKAVPTIKSISDFIIDFMLEKGSTTKPKARMNQECRFTRDLGLDSLDCIELIMECEKKYNIAIPDDRVEEWDTIGKLANGIYEILK